MLNTFGSKVPERERFKELLKLPGRKRLGTLEQTINKWTDKNDSMFYLYGDLPYLIILETLSAIYKFICLLYLLTYYFPRSLVSISAICMPKCRNCSYRILHQDELHGDKRVAVMSD